jgi:hypothetical protein
VTVVNNFRFFRVHPSSGSFVLFPPYIIRVTATGTVTSKKEFCSLGVAWSACLVPSKKNKFNRRQKRLKNKKPLYINIGERWGGKGPTRLPEERSSRKGTLHHISAVTTSPSLHSSSISKGPTAVFDFSAFPERNSLHCCFGMLDCWDRDQLCCAYVGHLCESHVFGCAPMPVQWFTSHVLHTCFVPVWNAGPLVIKL